MPTATTTTTTTTLPPPPGPRAQALLSLHRAALTSTLSALPPSTFLSCFPLLSTLSPSALHALHAQMIDKLRSAAEADFERILEERGVVGRLNELEGLIGEARGRRERGEGGGGGVAPHTLPPSSLLAAHLAPTLASTQSRLNAREQTLEGQNAELFEVVKKQWEEIEELVAGVEKTVGDLEEAGGMMGGVLERGR